MGGIDSRYYYYLTFGLLALCALIGLVVAFRFQHEVEHDLAPTTEKDLFGPLEKAFYAGLMDEAEFHRIRESMGRQKAVEPSKKPARPKPPAPTLSEAMDEDEDETEDDDA